MIEIDGSYGEGGGALLRVSAALSALLTQPIHVKNIRVSRPKKGLMPQHLNALKAVAQLANASFKGLEIGSEEVLFWPEKVEGGHYTVDIGTAGSITLVLQCFMLPAGFASSKVEITLRGGTDVRWSPSVDYLQHVTLPLLESMGYHAELDLIQRGHYPRGGGLLKAKIYPVSKLKSLNLFDIQIERIKGISHSVKLPEHVAIRQAKSAEDMLKSEGYEVDIEVKHSNRALGPGSGIVLWTEGNKNARSPVGRVGGSSIGEPGKKAEKVGQEAAKELLYHISRKAPLDRYIGDQIIPYLAMAGSSAVKIAELSQHTLTNIYVAEEITGRKFHIEGQLGDVAVIRIF
jgi:RNA 3'-phosphate cyclase